MRAIPAAASGTRSIKAMHRTEVDSGNAGGAEIIYDSETAGVNGTPTPAPALRLLCLRAQTMLGPRPAPACPGPPAQVPSLPAATVTRRLSFLSSSNQAVLPPGQSLGVGS